MIKHLTEEEARGKYCPMSLNRDGVVANRLCRASDCMAWEPNAGNFTRPWVVDDERMAKTYYDKGWEIIDRRVKEPDPRWPDAKPTPQVQFANPDEILGTCAMLPKEPRG